MTHCCLQPSPCGVGEHHHCGGTARNQGNTAGHDGGGCLSPCFHQDSMPCHTIPTKEHHVRTIPYSGTRRCPTQAVASSPVTSPHHTKPNQTKPTRPAPHRRQQQQRATLLKRPWPCSHHILGPQPSLALRVTPAHCKPALPCHPRIHPGGVSQTRPEPRT
jgi:hypothetical protein